MLIMGGGLGGSGRRASKRRCGIPCNNNGSICKDRVFIFLQMYETDLRKFLASLIRIAKAPLAENMVGRQFCMYITLRMHPVAVAAYMPSV
jgi:hypothetical protein